MASKMRYQLSLSLVTGRPQSFGKGLKGKGGIGRIGRTTGRGKRDELLDNKGARRKVRRDA